MELKSQQLQSQASLIIAHTQDEPNHEIFSQISRAEEVHFTNNNLAIQTVI